MTKSMKQSRTRVMLLVATLVIGCSHDGPTEPREPPLGSLVLAADSTELTIVGARATAVATLTDANGTVVVSPQVSFSSSNPRVVQVDADGTVTAQGPGIATVRASVGSLEAGVGFTVTISGPHGGPILGTVVPCTGGLAGPFPCDRMDLLSYMPHAGLGITPGFRLNDIWGWTDPTTGKEYALVGRVDGLTFVDVSDPLRPHAVGELPSAAPPKVWRDVKVYQGHAFVVSDNSFNHGVQVFDLRVLRLTETFTTFSEHRRYTELSDGHNIAINEATGFAYVVGGDTCGGGLHIIDISSPANPTFAGCFSDERAGRSSRGYIHDVQCILYDGPDADYAGREICVGSNETAISVADVTDKSNPVAVSIATYPTARYVHQGWFTEDRRYFLQNDELDDSASSTTRTLIWDMVDLDDPILAREFLGPTTATDHNLFVSGSRAYLSNYTAGLRVLDIADPLNPTEIAFFDTHPEDDATGFDGSWSNYPFFGSGIVVVSSNQEGLFIVRLQ